MSHLITRADYMEDVPLCAKDHAAARERGREEHANSCLWCNVGYALAKYEEERNRLREALRMVEENAVSFARSAAEASDPWMVGQIRQFFLDPARTALKKGE